MFISLIFLDFEGVLQGLAGIVVLFGFDKGIGQFYVCGQIFAIFSDGGQIFSSGLGVDAGLLEKITVFGMQVRQHGVVVQVLLFGVVNHILDAFCQCAKAGAAILPMVFEANVVFYLRVAQMVDTGKFGALPSLSSACAKLMFAKRWHRFRSVHFFPVPA